MTVRGLDIQLLVGHIDGRGASFSVPGDLLAGLPAVRDAHVTTITPGSVRGNHFHRLKRELLTVLAVDSWSAHWDTGEGTALQHASLGPGAFTFSPPLLWSHAIRNDGCVDLFMFSLTDHSIMEDSTTDSHVREVIA